MKTIIFDLSEVLLRGLLGTHLLIGERLGKEIAYKTLDIPELTTLFLGQISEELYWQAVIRRNQWELGVPDLKDLVRENF